MSPYWQIWRKWSCEEILITKVVTYLCCWSEYTPKLWFFYLYICNFCFRLPKSMFTRVVVNANYEWMMWQKHHPRGEQEFPFPDIPKNGGLWFPFPNFGNGFFHSLPVPEFREWIFFIPFPFPNFGNGFFSFPSRSRILGMGFFHSLPIPEIWEWIFYSLSVPEFREWTFSIPFPFPNPQKSFPLTPVIHSNSKKI